MNLTFVRAGAQAAVVLLALSASAINCGGAGGSGGGSQGGDPGTTTGGGGAIGSGSGGSTTTGSGGATASGAGGSTGAGGAKTTGSGGTTGTGGVNPSGCVGTLVKCGAVCVDTAGSQTNCGGCGIACRADQQCLQSACRCLTGQADCSGVCKDILASTVNCGACGNVCATGATCISGVCTCPTDQVACSGACKAVFSDPVNCGKCGTVCGAGTSCLFGACLDPASLACAPSAQANTSSTRDASITLGKYWVNNNWWGAASGSGSNTIWSTCLQGDLIGWGTSWNWTGQTNAVKSFASVVLGWQWGLKVPNTVLPLQLNAGKTLTCGWDFTITQTGGAANVTYDMFLHTIANPTFANDPTDEVMVWLYRANGAGPIGTKQATVTLATATWDLYRGATTTNVGTTLWNVFSYVRQTNATTASMNMMEFMNDLVSRGWVQPQKFLTSVQAGSEIFTGTGRLDTRGYTCRIQ